MSLSDGYLKGLSSPLPVPGANLPVDLVPYAGGPLDPLKQHIQKYKQLERMQRLSDSTSKRLLQELEEADSDMSKLSFIGSNPLSRRAYLMSKIAVDTLNAQAPVADTAPSVPPPSQSRDSFEFEDDLLKGDQEYATDAELGIEPRRQPAQPAPTPPPPATAQPAPLPQTPVVPPPSQSGPPIQVPRNLTRAPVKYQSREARPDLESGSPDTVRSRYVTGEGADQRELRYVGQNQEENLGNSGDFVNRLQEFTRGYNRMKKDPRLVGPTPEAPDNRGFFERMSDGIYHYGTRAARGLSTGAQMGASALYDAAARNNYLEDGTFLGDILKRSGREALNKEMALINASLGHSFGADSDYGKSYIERLKNIDTKLDDAEIQYDQALADQSAFRRKMIEDRLSNNPNYRGYTPAEREAARRREAEVVDNYYGFEGNTANTPRIGDDLTGTSFRNALSELSESSLVNPGKDQARAATLSQMMSGSPEIASAIEGAFGEEAKAAGVPLVEFAAKRLARDLSYDKQLTDAGLSPLEDDDVFETDLERLERYEATRDFTNTILENINEDDRGNFIAQMNPRVVQRAQEISGLMDKDPEAALRMVNDMDPQEARFLLDQISMLSKYVSPNRARSELDYSRYQVREDKNDFFPSFGGTDLVNPALQQIGAGGDYSQMAEDARDSVYFYNSMNEAPASEGQFYLVDDGNFINTYYNPTTGEVNREFLTNIGEDRRLQNTALPRQYYDQFKKRFGYIPNYRDSRGQSYLVDDGYFSNTYYDPITGKTETKMFTDFERPNQALPSKYHRRFEQQFGYKPNYRG